MCKEQSQRCEQPPHHMGEEIMKKIIAASAIAVGLIVPLGSAAVAHEVAQPATNTAQGATDQVVIQGPDTAGLGRWLDIAGKAGKAHTGERIELRVDGRLVDSDIRAPKVLADGTFVTGVKTFAVGNHSYEVRLYDNNGQLTAISNVINIYTK